MAIDIVPSELGSLSLFFSHILLVDRGQSDRKNHVAALNHLTRFLGRAAAITDLCTSTIDSLVSELIETRLRYETIKSIRKKLVSSAKAAHRLGLLAQLPDSLSDDLERRCFNAAQNDHRRNRRAKRLHQSASHIMPDDVGSLLLFVDQFFLVNRGKSDQKNHLAALNHLTKFLGRPPSIVDLNTEVLEDLLSSLIESGLRYETVNDLRIKLLAAAKAAQKYGLLPATPDYPVAKFEKRYLPELEPPLESWSISELNQILGSAKTMEGSVGDISAARWWFALITTMLNTEQSYTVLLSLPKSAFDHRSGSLLVGTKVHKLKPVVVEALTAIKSSSDEKLFPWPWDNGESPFHTLIRRMKFLIHRASLPVVSRNLFTRLLITAVKEPNILDQVEMNLLFAPRPGAPLFIRARDRRREAARIVIQERRLNDIRQAQDIPTAEGQNSDSISPESITKAELPNDQLFQISLDPRLTLLQFFNQIYCPQRLGESPEKTIKEYRTVIGSFSRFLACDATFEHLEDDIVERFLVWIRRAKKLSPFTVNRYRACLLAVWKHAYRKRKVNELPRDIPRAKCPKVLPEAWSDVEIGKIVVAARNLKGVIGLVPACDFWNALILALYETGLRISALMTARVADFRPEDGWLFIRAQNQKQNADQVFRLSPETIAAVVAITKSNSEFIFNWPFDQTGHWKKLWKTYREILKSAGLNHGRRDLFHKIRRTSASAVCRILGADAAQFHLGHSSAAVTRAYLDPRRIATGQFPSELIPRPAIDGLSNEIREAST